MNFKTSKNLVKINIKQGETKQETINIENTGAVSLNFEIEQEGLEDLLIVSEDSFVLEADQKKAINIVAFASETQKAGVYTGKLRIKSNVKEEVVIIIIEIKERTALFDIKVEVKENAIQQGQKVEAEITLLNLGDLKPVDVELYYAIRDLENNNIVFKSDTLAVEDKKTIKRKLKIPAYLKPGKYMFYAEARYNGQIAVSSSVIEVIEPGDIGAGYIGPKPGILSQVTNFIASTWIFILIIVLTVAYYNWGTQINQKLERIGPFGRREIRKPYIRKPEVIKVIKPKIRKAEQLEKEKLLKKLNEWKDKGYDTSVLEAELKDKAKPKIRKAEQLEKEKLLKKLNEWKDKGYDTTLLEAELRDKSKVRPKLSNKEEINKLTKKMQEWKSKGYDTRLLEQEIKELEKKK